MGLGDVAGIPEPPPVPGAATDQVQQAGAPAAVAEPPAAENGHAPPAPPTGGGVVTIRFGDTEVPVYAQRHAYLENRLSRVLTGFAASGEDLNADNLLSFFGTQTYDVLAALIPNLPNRLPRHIFAGYESQEAMDAGTYDPAKDVSPTYPEIIEAFKACIRVNRLDVLGGIKNLVDPSMLRGVIRLKVAEWMEKESSKSSAKSPHTNGESDQTSSGQPPQT